jgi:DNA primase
VAKITELVHKIYQKNLIDKKEGIEYLEKRGITKEDAFEFKLGLHSKGILEEKLTKKEIDQALNISDSLFFDHIITKDNKTFQDFQSRIIYPLYKKNLIGEYGLVGFQSRATSDSDEVFKHRYLNNFYYNIFNEQAINKTNDSIIMTEGQNDCIILCKHGFNAIGIMAVNSFNKENALAIRNSDIKNVYIIFDNDINKSGDRAAIKTASILDEIGIKTKIGFIPSYKKSVDVNEYYLQNKQEFKKNILKIITSSMEFKRSNTKKYNNFIVKKRTNFSKIHLSELWDFPATMSHRIAINCPFNDHEDSKKSFMYYPDKNDFYCWGCGRGGGPIEFFTYLNNFNSREDAIMYLNERFDKYENFKYTK